MVLKITHFFTKCALYAVSRTSLLRFISNILIQNDLQNLSPTELSYTSMVTPIVLYFFIYGFSLLGKQSTWLDIEI